MSTLERPLVLRRLAHTFVVCRMDAAHPVEPWMQRGPLWSITRTPDELSVVCTADVVPSDVRSEGLFAGFMVEGPLDFALTGILSRLAVPLAQASVPIFVVSTFDTDYVLVPERQASAAVRAWETVGISVVPGRPYK